MKPLEHEHITLKEFITEKFNALEKSTESARVSMEKRLDGMNEFRDTLKDQAAKFVTRDDLTIRLDSIGLDIQGLRESRAELAGKASQSSVIGAYVITIISILLSIISLVIKMWK